jgi:hypothetical protein
MLHRSAKVKPGQDVLIHELCVFLGRTPDENGPNLPPPRNLRPLLQRVLASKRLMSYQCPHWNPATLLGA